MLKQELLQSPEHKLTLSRMVADQMAKAELSGWLQVVTAEVSLAI